MYTMGSQPAPAPLPPPRLRVRLRACAASAPSDTSHTITVVSRLPAPHIIRAVRTGGLVLGHQRVLLGGATAIPYCPADPDLHMALRTARLQWAFRHTRSTCLQLFSCKSKPKP